MIIGISGRKQSGKSTTGNFLFSLKLAELGISEKIHIDNEGRIVVSDLFGDTNYAGILDLSKPINDYMFNRLHESLNPIIKLYSFADPLKQDICMGMFGMSYEQCYGSDEDKNSLTSLRWSDMPEYNHNWIQEKNIHESGYMTARDVMEFVGTSIFRKMKNDIWVAATLNKISNEKPELAIIVDCRFPNEIESIKKTGGKVIRLSRNPFNSNAIAEKALDKEVYDWNNFDYICDNENMTIYDQCVDIQKFLQENLSL